MAIFGENSSQFSKFFSKFHIGVFRPNEKKLPRGYFFETWRSQGGGYHTPNRKRLLQKRMSFAKFWFLATKFPRNSIKTQVFSWSFIKNCQRFSIISQSLLFFVLTRESLPHDIEFFCKIGENAAFLQFSWRIFLLIFENSPASRGPRPRTPYEAGPPTLNPRNFSCVRHWLK